METVKKSTFKLLILLKKNPSREKTDCFSYMQDYSKRQSKTAAGGFYANVIC